MYLIFSGYFAAEGLIYPFWPTWLASLGFGASQIGLLIAAAYWPQVIAGVALTYVADWRIDQLRLATLLTAARSACATWPASSSARASTASSRGSTR